MFVWKNTLPNVAMFGVHFFSNVEAVAALQQTFFSLASIQAKTRGSEQNIQGIES